MRSIAPAWLRAPRSWLEAWLAEVRLVRRHPLVDPSGVPFPRASIVFFWITIPLGLLVLVPFASARELLDGWVILFAAAALLTDFAEIRFPQGRVVTGNDLFWIVPVVWFDVGEAATFLLLTLLLDPILHPRSLVRASARMSSTVISRLSMWGAVLLAAQFVPPDEPLRPLLLVLAAYAGTRANDYFWFPLSMRVALGPQYAYREHVRSSIGFDLVRPSVELPVIALAAYGYSISPWLVLAMVGPTLAVWRLTRLRPMVTQLEESDRLKTRFMSIASHELRTPLTSISGFASTLRHRWSSFADEEKLSFVEIIEQQSARLARLVGDMLTISRIESGALQTHQERVDVKDLVQRTLVELDVLDKVDVHGSSLEAFVDRDHMQQILINYISNAFKYGAEPVSVSIDKHGPDVEVRVTDHGAGVRPEFQPYLFEMFARDRGTDSVEGTGLGLPIVRSLAEAQGGRAWYEQTAQGGSCFAVRVPLATSGDAARV